MMNVVLIALLIIFITFIIGFLSTIIMMFWLNNQLKSFFREQLKEFFKEVRHRNSDADAA